MRSFQKLFVLFLILFELLNCLIVDGFELSLVLLLNLGLDFGPFVFDLLDLNLLIIRLLIKRWWLLKLLLLIVLILSLSLHSSWTLVNNLYLLLISFEIIHGH